MKLRNVLTTVLSTAVLAACGGGESASPAAPTQINANIAPVARAGATQNVMAGTLVTLDGSTSSDGDNDSLTYKWTLTSKAAGSVATLASPTSAKPTFTADVAGTYVVTLTVNDGKADSAASSTVTITASTQNAAPVANAGSPQNLATGGVVTLDGSSSSDANGDALTYAWSLTAKPAGSAAVLASSTSVKPSFTADVAGSYVAKLIVNDGKVDSAAATVAITASTANAAPIANAGVAQSVVTGAVVTLNGSISSDANGDTLTYAWALTSKPAGSLATLSSPTSAKPTFTADIAGTFVASLIVNDGKVNSTAVTVAITAATANAAPVANAGVAQSLVSGSLVTLDGSASSDANGDALTYAWNLTAKPAGSAAILASASSVKPTFTADMAGTYAATLIVNDGKANSASSTVTITVSLANAAPVANAGPNQNIVAGSMATLDGSASSDANGDTLTYAWALTSKPAGSSATLASPNSANPSFMADIAGTYVTTLVVNDGKINSSSSTVTITASVANAAPVANAGPAQSVEPGSLVTLDGSASSDANGDTLTYAWSLTAKPAGSFSSKLTASNTIRPSFLADVEGTYVATLVVNDGKINSASTTVTVNAVTSIAPLKVGAGTFAQAINPYGQFQKLDDTTGVVTAQPNACQQYIAADTAPDGRVIAVASNSKVVAEIDILTGKCRTLFIAPEPMTAIAVASDGTIVTISAATSFGAYQVYRFTPYGIQLGKVATEIIEQMGDLMRPSIDFSPDGTLYAVSLGKAYSLDPVTGNISFKALVSTIGDIDIDSMGILRGLYSGTMNAYSSTTWQLIRSRILEKAIFALSPLVRR